MATNAKEIIFEEEARNLLGQGIKKLADVVGFTLGPKGRNVSVESSWGAPKVTSDGSLIVKEISFENQFENLGADMAKEVVEQIKESCGDGTTTGTLLLNALTQQGIKNVSSGASPILLKRGMDKAVTAVIETIKKSATKISQSEDIRKIALASSSGNQEVAKFITEAMEKVGKEGVITIEEAKGTETVLDNVEGMQFDRGYLSAYFCTNSENMTVDFDEPSLLVTDKKITTVQDILPLLQASASTAKPLIIIAEEIEGDALSTLVINRIRGTLKVAAIKAPGFGDKRKEMLKDIAHLTGATYVSDETDMQLKDVGSEVLGSCERIHVTKDDTTIVNGRGSETGIKARIAQIENEIKNTTSKYELESLEKRKAKLCGGVAVIRVGAATEPELKQKKQLFEDSLNSTKAAVAEGVVIGGGVALLQAKSAIDTLDLKGDALVGARIVSKACETPIRQLITNAAKDPSVIINEALSKGPNYGFNCATEKVEDLQAAGILDPAKVISTSLAHAAANAGVVLLSEALIGDAPEDDKED